MRISLWIVFLFLAGFDSAAARLFETEGSDLLMGVGAAQIAQGGAVVASENGLYSLYWNPAGLSDIHENQITLSGQFNRPLAHISFAGIAYVLPYFSPFGFRGTVGISYLPRVHFKAKGTFKESELETAFLNTALPGMPGGFSGKLDSKTNDYRLGIGGTFDLLPRLSLGASIGRVKCHTLFSGYHKESLNPADIEIHANAWAIDLGAKYRLTNQLTFGATLKHINGDLDVHTVTTDTKGTRIRTSNAPFVKDISFGVDYRYSPNWQFAFSYQMLYGHYSKSTFDIRLLRIGGTYHTDSLDYHFGLIAPFKIQTVVIKDLKLPAPVLPTVGLTYRHGRTTYSVAAYIHPVMTFATHRLKPALDLSISHRF